jgi:hypothetical protein
VLYVPVKDFDESNGDEVISLLSRYQYTDWTALRLEAPSSPEYRKELHKLAQKLADVAESVAKKQLEREIEVIERAENQDATASLGLIDLMEKIAELLPSWLEAMESDVINDAQFNATWEVLGERLSRLRRRPGSGGAEFALIQRIAKEELPISRRYLGDAQVYSQKAIELDPLILELLRLCDASAVDLEYLEPVRSALSRAYLGILLSVKGHESGLQTAGQWARRRAHMSRLVAEVAATFEAGERLVVETNRIVSQWIAEWERVTGQRIEDVNDLEVL